MKFEEEHFTNFELTPLKGYANESCFAPLNADNAICATTLITNLQAQDDILLASFSANVRNEIRKCEKEYNPQILINENPTQEDIEVHLQYYKAWLDSKKIELIGNIEFYRHRLNVYRKNNSLAIITAKSILLKNLIQDTLFVDKEDKIIRLTTSISTFRNGDSQSQKINAALNKFMKYEIAKHFRNKAFRTFDWGALKNTALSDSKMGGVSEFKKHCSKI